MHLLDTGAHVEDEEPIETIRKWAATAGHRFWDDVTGYELPVEPVRVAHEDEMDYMARLKVYGYSTVDESFRVTGAKPLGTRWVNTNRGDAANPDIRCRLVAQETRYRSTLEPGDIAATFAATPPIEALRMLGSLYMSVDSENTHDYVLLFLDISRAHPNCPVDRDIFIDLPPEDPKSSEQGVCGKLPLCS